MSPRAFSSRCITRAEYVTGSTYFTASEFRAPERMGYEFILWLNTVRAHADVPMHISSDHRTPAHNASVGGARDSAHVDVPCDSVDISFPPTPDDPHGNTRRFAVLSAAIRLGCTRVGLYPNGSLHLDRTEDRRPAPRCWVAVDRPASPLPPAVSRPA